MIALTGDHKTLYDLLQAKAKASLARLSGTEVGDLGDNERLAADIGNLPIESVAELIKRETAAQVSGHVW
jgi:hypothetical protein